MSDAVAIEREVLECDAVIVGAGPAGLSCAIRLKQLKPDLSICVLEKGSSVGAHSLSGAVLEPAPLEQLLPNWRTDYTGMPGCVASSLRMLASNCSGNHRHWPPSMRYAKRRRS